MSVSARKTSYQPGRFCAGCLTSKEGIRYQVRIKNSGCTYDIYLCKSCFKELAKALEVLK